MWTKLNLVCTRESMAEKVSTLLLCVCVCVNRCECNRSSLCVALLVLPKTTTHPTAMFGMTVVYAFVFVSMRQLALRRGPPWLLSITQSVGHGISVLLIMDYPIKDTSVMVFNALYISTVVPRLRVAWVRILPRTGLLFPSWRNSCPGCNWPVCFALCLNCYLAVDTCLISPLVY